MSTLAPSAARPGLPPSNDAGTDAAPRPRDGQAAASSRDLRLDLFRGLALIFIFLDHVPGNFAGWLTVRNFGFSDATEIFVFISGYAAAVSYGAIMDRHGLVVGGARIVHRVWQLYVAHIFLFVVFTAQIAWVAARFDNPMYAEEMNLLGFLEAPHVNLLQALALRFRPANMDVLPLYIVLLAGFVFVLPILQRHPRSVLAASALLWFVAGRWNWHLSDFPDGRPWLFNPLCWQFLFIVGAWFGTRPALPAPSPRAARAITVTAIAWLAFALLIVVTWHFEQLAALVPDALARWMYPIDKPNLDALRLLHFLALAWLAVRWIPRDARFLRSHAIKPILWCGQSSLQVFCLGTFLAFTGHFYLAQIDGSLPAQLWVSTMGVAAMMLTGATLSWYRRAQKRQRSVPPAQEARG
jgi:hypothetical protein